MEGEEMLTSETMERRKAAARFMLAVMACCTLATAAATYAQGTGSAIDIGGTDGSDKMTTMTDLGSTAVGFILKVVAKVIGVGIAVWGITDLVRRDVMWGAVKLFLCGACFFLDKIIASLAAIAGGGASAGG
jgi:hypothetical protein